MSADPLEQVLRLVSEGKLTADEAAPILAALDDRKAAQAAQPASDRGAGTDSTRGGPSALRIEVKDGGRTVVNLRLPISIGRFALDRVPGLSGDQVDRVREALNSGQLGPVLTVDDNGSGVRIVLE